MVSPASAKPKFSRITITCKNENAKSLPMKRAFQQHAKLGNINALDKLGKNRLTGENTSGLLYRGSNL